MEEVWKEAVGFEGLYEISNKGRIRNRRGRVMRPAPNSKGYPATMIRKDGKYHSAPIHRFVAKAFLGPPTDEAPIVNHIDGNPMNNSADNLEWCSQGHNVIHAMRLSSDSLSDDDIRSIRKAGKPRMCPACGHSVRKPQHELAKEYNVSQGTISSIIQRKSHKSV
jgi:hypothetical protein